MKPPTNYQDLINVNSWQGLLKLSEKAANHLLPRSFMSVGIPLGKEPTSFEQAFLVKTLFTHGVEKRRKRNFLI